jgi:putative intracellular protease/amidase/YHS domain-containing protein
VISPLLNPIRGDDGMNEKNLSRRKLLQASGLVGLAAAIPGSISAARAAGWRDQASSAHKSTGSAAAPNPLKPPASGSINVAFVISQGAVLIDFAGPWEVFQDATIPSRHMMDSAFELYTVAGTLNPITVSGGLQIVPNYTFQNAPPPKIIVIPAQHGASDVMLDWIRKASKTTDVTMSVCTGAYVLAATGLLNGKSATTHHAAYADLAMQFPDVKVVRGVRFVEEGNLATAGGLTSGMDLALRTVGRYFGPEAIRRTAFQLEYQGKGWRDAGSNSEFAVKPPGDICAVCWMQVDRKIALAEVYKGRTYFFCMDSHKDLFDAKPDNFIDLLSKS